MQVVPAITVFPFIGVPGLPAARVPSVRSNSDSLTVPRSSIGDVDVTLLSDSSKRNFKFIAQNGVPLHLPIGFRANNGRGIDMQPYPPSIAPPDVIEIHITKLLAKGKGILLPLVDAQRLCAASGLQLHVSNAFLQPKLNAILLRFIIDYTNPRLWH